MLTQEQIIKAIKSGRESETLDGRDYERLLRFLPIEQWEALGYEVREGVNPETLSLTEKSVLVQLERDLDFAFNKALNKRGISASLMVSVVKMWMWVLEDPLQHCEKYSQYGLPFLKKVALKYGFTNPIGDDEGTESKYAAD